MLVSLHKVVNLLGMKNSYFYIIMLSYLASMKMMKMKTRKEMELMKMKREKEMKFMKKKIGKKMELIKMKTIMVRMMVKMMLRMAVRMIQGVNEENCMWN